MISSARSGVSTSRKPRSSKNARNFRSKAARCCSEMCEALGAKGWQVDCDALLGDTTHLAWRKQRWRHLLPGDEWRHRAVEHVANRTQQLAFGNIRHRVGADAGGAGVNKSLAMLWRYLCQIAQCLIDRAQAASIRRQQL